jgi:hypothetical protein
MLTRADGFKESAPDTHTRQPTHSTFAGGAAWIRRTHATHLYIAGGDATQSLGHESDAMTRTYYLDKSQIRTHHPADLLTVGLLRRWWRKMKLAVRRF